MTTLIRVVVYINGIRFYPRAVTVTSQVGGLLNFSVDVVPVSEWQILPPRSHVVVFFTDPTTQVWRLLCEGEYIGWSRSKTANGDRSRVLNCRGLFGFMDQVSNFAIAGLSDNQAASALRAWATGSEIVAPADGQHATIASIGAMLSESHNANPTKLYSDFLPRMIQRISKQANVDAFYFEARRLVTKLFSMPDAEIARLVDVNQLDDVAKNGFGSFGLTPDTPLSQIVAHIEAVANYVHVPLLAPPVYDTKPVVQGTTWSVTPKLPELLFTPTLYETVPPACNVIFHDQIVSISGGLDYSARPTRVIGDLTSQALLSTSALPVYYMANGVSGAAAVSAVVNMSPTQAVTHGLFSDVELYQGVVARHVPISLERVFPAGKQTDAGLAGSPTNSNQQLSGYAALSVQASLQALQGDSATATILTQFQPYVVAGFTLLVEDGDTPFHGYVASVTHSIPNGGSPSTTISVTQVREAYQTVGKSRTAPLSLHMNAAYTPAEINDTYQQMLGCDAMASKAVVTAAVSEDLVAAVTALLTGFSAEAVPKQVDMDTLAGQVVRVPRYSDGNSVGYVVETPIADLLRQETDPKDAQYLYQYRAGTTLAQYLAAHGQYAADTELLDGAMDPPATLLRAGSEDVLSNGNYLTPTGMTFAAATSAKSYGLYDIAGVSALRVSITQTIATAIDAGLTDGSR